LDLKCNFTQKYPLSTFLTIRVDILIPTKIPPDLPQGGRQNQAKSAIPARLFKKDFEKMDLPVSIKAIKSRPCSQIASLTKRCLPGS
jgi:hypothetical protein